MSPRKRASRAGNGKVFVLDGSVSLAWFFEDEMNSYAEAVEDSLKAATIVVPSLWALEVANALVVGERRKRTSAAMVTQFVRLLDALPITVDSPGNARMFGDVLPLARAHQLSTYDAAYLELAVRRGLPLATLDKKLQAAAQAAGVQRYEP